MRGQQIVSHVSSCLCGLPHGQVALDLPALFMGSDAELEAIPVRLEAIPIRLEAIPIRLKAIPIRLEAIPIRLEAIPSRLEAIPISSIRLAIASRLHS